MSKNNDLHFLKEMKAHWDKAQSDITSYEYLGKMIDDWILELEQEKEC